MSARHKPFTVVRDEVHQDPGASRGGVVAIGNFEGVHRGHCVVIDKAIGLARSLGGPASVLTFEPHRARSFVPTSRCSASVTMRQGSTA